MEKEEVMREGGETTKNESEIGTFRSCSTWGGNSKRF